MVQSKEVRRLRQKRKLLLNRVAAIRDFARGSVVLMKRRCTYPGCRKCASGERHPTWVLTVSRHGKTHTVYLGKQRVREARRLTENHRRLMELVERIGEVNLALLKQRALPRKGEDDGSRAKAS